MYKEDISEQIQEEIKNFEEEDIEIVEGYTFNQKYTVDQIYRYYNSKFESGEFDSQGEKKFFFNISKYRAETSSKEIDLDTKDIRLRATEDKFQFKSLIFGKEIKDWMKEYQFGKTLNQIADELPVYGTVVIKRDKLAKSGISIVDLRNLVNDQTVGALIDSDFIIEKHIFTPTQLRKHETWDDVDEVVAEAEENEIDEIEVYERYGEVPGEWMDSKEDYVDACFIVAILIPKDKRKKKKHFVLDSFTITEIPYREVHYARVKGRWLGRGVIEDLFESQFRINELVNLKSKNFKIATLILMQTKDELIYRNLLTDVESGDILQTEGLSQVGISPRDFGAESNEQDRWDILSDKHTFAHDVVRGETMPAGTPARSTMILARAISKFYARKREDFGMFVKEVFFDFILPQTKKKLKKEHIVEYIAEDVDFSDIKTLIAKERLNAMVKKYVKKKGRLPAIEDMKTTIMEILDERKSLFIKIPESFYKNFRFSFDMVITGESRDIDTEIDNLQWALTAVATNPNLLADDNLRSLFFKVLEVTGVNPSALFKIARPALAVPGAPGAPGAAPSPVPPPTPERARGLRIPGEVEAIEETL